MRIERPYQLRSPQDRVLHTYATLPRAAEAAAKLDARGVVVALHDRRRPDPLCVQAIVRAWRATHAMGA